MGKILTIHTAVDIAHIVFAVDGQIVAHKAGHEQRQQAVWLHESIREVLSDAGVVLSDLDAFAVTAGPGSYTGIRIGLSAVKGLCYALDKPLIALSVLEVLAFQHRNEGGDFICPMIDARRMEVFTGVYNRFIEEQVVAYAEVLTTESYSKWLQQGTVLFVGNAVQKAKTVINNSQALFIESAINPAMLALLSQKRLEEERCADLAYQEAIYAKPFYTTATIHHIR